MKHRTDWQAQQYRIRAEHAQRCAVEAWDRAIGDAMNRSTILASYGLVPAPARIEDDDLWAPGTAQKH